MVEMGKKSGDIPFGAISICFLVALIYSTLLLRGIASTAFSKFQVSKQEGDLRGNVSDINKDYLGSSSIVEGDLVSNISVDPSVTDRLESLLPGAMERRELEEKGIVFISAPSTDMCLINRAVRIETSTSTLYHSAHVGNESRMLQAYPRKLDSFAMSKVTPITLVSIDNKEPPPCDVSHDVPALVFSTGGYAGNFYHTMNDILLSLFITSRHFQSQVQFVATDFQDWWVHRFNPMLKELSPLDTIRYDYEDGRVHCFPGAVLGLKYHSELHINTSDTPNANTIVDFKRFLISSFAFPNDNVVPSLNLSTPSKPILVLISRKGSRVLLNEADLINEARSLGFKVVRVLQQEMLNMKKFAKLVNSCSVLLGIHGAGLSNMLFLPSGSVLIQVVPLGLDWAATAYYSEPSGEMDIHYREYRITPRESSLYDQYPPDDPVFTDPGSVYRKGYNFAKAIYLDGQNINLDIERFRDTLEEAIELLQASSD